MNINLKEGVKEAFYIKKVSYIIFILFIQKHYKRKPNPLFILRWNMVSDPIVDELQFLLLSMKLLMLIRIILLLEIFLSISMYEALDCQ